MTKAYLGVQIDQNRLNVVEVNNKKIQRYMFADIPEGIVDNDSIISFSAIEDIIRQLIKNNKVRTKNVALVLQNGDVFTRKMTMPSMTEGQLEINLPYEFKDYITEEKEAYTYDYAITGVNKDEEGNIKTLDMIAAAALNTVLEQYKRMFRNAGLKLVQALPREFAIGNVMNTITPSLASHDIAIFDVGHTSSTIYIYHNGVFDTDRTIDEGIQTLAVRASQIINRDVHIALNYIEQNTDDILNHPDLQDVYGNIAVDVMRSINYYTYENRDNTLDTLYVTGEGSNIIPLLRSLNETLSINVVHMKDFVDSEEEKQALVYAISATGACFNEEEK